MKKRKPSYTDEELLGMIRSKAKELGRIPACKEVPHIGIITNRFGTWNKALDQTGLIEKTEYTDEELLEIIKAKAEKLERMPKLREMSEARSIVSHFGSWRRALEQAEQKYTDEELLEIIKVKTKELGRTPKATETPYLSTILKRFGNWDKALEQLGMVRILKHTDEELLDAINAKAKELGRIPSCKEISYLGVIIKRFGSWNNALKQAGLIEKINYTNEELLELIRAKAKEFRRMPKDHEMPEARDIANRFGGWNKALKQAEQKYTDEELLENIRAKTKELGRIPKATETPYLSTILKRFGSWNKALEQSKILK